MKHFYINTYSNMSKMQICGHLLAGILGSNPTRGMDVCLLWLLFVVG